MRAPVGIVPVKRLAAPEMLQPIADPLLPCAGGCRTWTRHRRIGERFDPPNYACVPCGEIRRFG